MGAVGWQRRRGARRAGGGDRYTDSLSTSPPDTLPPVSIMGRFPPRSAPIPAETTTTRTLPGLVRLSALVEKPCVTLSSTPSALLSS